MQTTAVISELFTLFGVNSGACCSAECFFSSSYSDCCPHLFTRLSKSSSDGLQVVQNAALTWTSKRSSCSLSSHESRRIHFKLLVMTHRAQHCQAPAFSGQFLQHYVSFMSSLDQRLLGPTFKQKLVFIYPDFSLVFVYFLLYCAFRALHLQRQNSFLIARRVRRSICCSQTRMFIVFNIDASQFLVEVIRQIFQ